MTAARIGPSESFGPPDPETMDRFMLAISELIAHFKSEGMTQDSIALALKFEADELWAESNRI